MALSKYVKAPAVTRNLTQYTENELRKIEQTAASFLAALEELDMASRESGSFVVTTNGLATELQVTVTYIKIDRLVILSIPSFSGVSDANVMELLGMPAHLQPNYDTPLMIALVIDNSSAVYGYGGIGSDDVIRFAPSAAAAFSGWTASGTKSVIRTTLIYFL